MIWFVSYLVQSLPRRTSMHKIKTILFEPTDERQYKAIVLVQVHEWNHVATPNAFIRRKLSLILLCLVYCSMFSVSVSVEIYIVMNFYMWLFRRRSNFPFYDRTLFHAFDSFYVALCPFRISYHFVHGVSAFLLLLLSLWFVCVPHSWTKQMHIVNYGFVVTLHVACVR